MKIRKLIFSLILSTSAFAQLENLPVSPLDTNMGEAAFDVGGTVNQTTPNPMFEREQEIQKEEELLENRYDVPDPKEEREFNKNGPSGP